MGVVRVAVFGLNDPRFVVLQDLRVRAHANSNWLDVNCSLQLLWVPGSNTLVAGRFKESFLLIQVTGPSEPRDVWVLLVRHDTVANDALHGWLRVTSSASI